MFDPVVRCEIYAADSEGEECRRRAVWTYHGTPVCDKCLREMLERSPKERNHVKELRY